MRLIHTLKPIYNKDSKILLLGSFPSRISRENNFYYANPSNRFWMIMEYLFNTRLENINDKKEFLESNNIALYDVVYSCEIHYSSDSSIKNIVPSDINTIINNSNIKYIFVLNKKALELYNKFLLEKTKIEAIYLPSTSSANASFSLNKLIDEYKIIIDYL